LSRDDLTESLVAVEARDRRGSISVLIDGVS
jgi:hypothetical protein